MPSETIGAGVGALAVSAFLFVMLRWHRNCAFANARLQRLLGEQLPSAIQMPSSWTYAYSWTLILLGEILASIVAVVLWMEFAGGVVMAMRGQSGEPIPPAPSRIGSSGPNAAGVAFFFFFTTGIALFGLGLYLALHRERCARFARWLSDTTIPIESRLTSHDLAGGRLHWGWRLYVTALAIMGVVLGATFVAAAFDVFR